MYIFGHSRYNIIVTIIYLRVEYLECSLERMDGSSGVSKAIQVAPRYCDVQADLSILARRYCNLTTVTVLQCVKRGARV